MISNRTLTVAACVLVLCLCAVPVPIVRAASVWVRPVDANGDVLYYLVNASDFWDSRDYPQAEWFYDLASVLMFNESHLNATIIAIATAGNKWNITGYIINSSGSIDINETMLNATIAALAVNGSRWLIDNVYLVNASGTLTLNESKLNDTIDARDDNTQLTQEAVQDMLGLSLAVRKPA